MPWLSWWVPPPCCPRSAGSAPMQVVLKELAELKDWTDHLVKQLLIPYWNIFDIIWPIPGADLRHTIRFILLAATRQACPLCFATPSSWPCSCHAWHWTPVVPRSFFCGALSRFGSTKSIQGQWFIIIFTYFHYQNIHKLGYSIHFETHPTQIVDYMIPIKKHQLMYAIGHHHDTLVWIPTVFFKTHPDSQSNPNICVLQFSSCLFLCRRIARFCPVVPHN